jgi:hypothetical protein
LDDLQAYPDDLVERIARTEDSKADNQLSFASKFCSFYCDPDRFPIYDSRAQVALRIHEAGTIAPSFKYPTYNAFRVALSQLISQNSFSASFRELDHYLYLFGSYVLKRGTSQEIYRDVGRIFSEHISLPDKDVTDLLFLLVRYNPVSQKEEVHLTDMDQHQTVQL